MRSDGGRELTEERELIKVPGSFQFFFLRDLGIEKWDLEREFDRASLFYQIPFIIGYRERRLSFLNLIEILSVHSKSTRTLDRQLAPQRT